MSESQFCKIITLSYPVEFTIVLIVCMAVCSPTSPVWGGVRGSATPESPRSTSVPHCDLQWEPQQPRTEPQSVTHCRTSNTGQHTDTRQHTDRNTRQQTGIPDSRQKYQTADSDGRQATLAGGDAGVACLGGGAAAGRRQHGGGGALGGQE